MSSDEHGWLGIGTVTTSDGSVTGVGAAYIGPVVDERFRCGCTRRVLPCENTATQEDLLCDDCRAHRCYAREKDGR